MTNVFKKAEYVFSLMNALIHNILSSNPESKFILSLLVDNIFDLTNDDMGEEAIAYVHIECTRIIENVAQFPIQHAFIVSSMAHHAGIFSCDQIKHIISAALLSNISYVSNILEYSHSKNSLSENQRLILEKHPEHSVLLCKNAGIDNIYILNLIINHHQQTKQNSQIQFLKINDLNNNLSNTNDEYNYIYIAERYISMIAERRLRESMVIDAARLLIEQNIKSQSVLKTFKKAIPRMPAGMFVCLSSGDVAVIKKTNPMTLCSVIDKSGVYYMNSKEVLYDSKFTLNKIIGTFKGDRGVLTNCAELVWLLN